MVLIILARILPFFRLVKLYLRKLMFMRTALFFSILLVSTICQAQSLEELDERNGFKDIKLLSNATEYSTLEFKSDLKDQEFHALYVKTNDAYETIGEAKIKSLEVLTYKNLIYQITVVTDKDPNLFKGLQKAFGKANHSVVDNLYHWNTAKVSLSFGSEGKKKLKLVYYAHGIKQIIKEDKEKKVEDLSSEF